ncbi:MAG: hypothetical protein P8L18_00175 [Verrucomicrobiota bacterium]|jgi:hypothetical protein|nr:hypothetical protein [Verrucomicrobiota bacterium]MDG1889694.1 hypothetical protein [Verrucomicrobiota bacterium]
MNNKTGIISSLLVAAVALLLSGVGGSARADSGSLSVASIDGGATIDNGDGAAALSDESEIGPGSVLSTGSSGSAVIVLGDVGRIKIGPDTTLIINRANSTETGDGVTTDTLLTLRDGCVTGVVNRFTSGLSKFEVKIPTGTVGIDASEEASEFNICTPTEVSFVGGAGSIVYTRDGVVRSARGTSGNQFSTETGGFVPIPAPEMAAIEQVVQEVVVVPGAAPIPAPVPVVVQPNSFFISPVKGGGS